MWKLWKSTSRGGFSARSILTYGLAALLVAFLWSLITSHTTFAADASWSGSNINYESNEFTPAKANTSENPHPPIANGASYYRNIEPTSSGGTVRFIYFSSSANINKATSAQYQTYELDRDGNSRKVIDTAISLIPKEQSGDSASKAVWLNGDLILDSNTYTGPKVSDGKNPPLPNGVKYYEYLDRASKKASFIYFDSSVDPPTASSAKYQTYSLGSDAFGNLQWNDASTVKTIDVDVQTAANTNTTDVAQTSCDVEGIGWIVCPTSNFLAWGMDRIFEALKGFLVVEPLATATDAPLYKAWNAIRSIANVAFVIAFIVIIYSQLTSLGLDNYGIKKLLPRLIIAAILVNLSYLICAVAVDLSNVIGISLQELLVGMREALNGPNVNSIVSWESITGFILSNTAVAGVSAAALGGVVITTGGSLGAALILLLPILLSLILAVLVALIVLAARQALIIILIIVSPLAFVAYLLPNTEKLFEKWRSLFVTMLVFFPLFALIFGGSQLAGFLIIQNAHDINVILLAMFVQVAPLVLTPLLIRFSGGLIGRIAGFVNDPKKGFVDRTRNWAKDRSEYLASKNMARRDPVRGYQLGRRFALSYDRTRRIREGRKSAYNAWSDAQWTQSQSFSDIDQLNREATDVKTTGESQSAARYGEWKSNTPAGQRVDTRLRLSQVQAENSTHQLEANWERNNSSTVMRERVRAETLSKTIGQLKKEHEADFAQLETGSVSSHLRNVQGINSYSAVAREALQRTNIASSRLNFAQMQQQVDFANALKNSAALAAEAGGIADQGAKRARSNASAVISRANQDTIKAIKDTTSIRAGDVPAMVQAIESAMAQNDILTIRAYSDMLSESANPGIDALRKMIGRLQTQLSQDDLQDVKEHINANAAANSGAEDIGTWSRDVSGRTIEQITRDVKTYNEMTPVGFASNKKSTQIEAFKIGAVSASMASEILSNPTARGNLKPSMRLALENIRSYRPWYQGVDVNLDED